MAELLVGRCFLPKRQVKALTDPEKAESLRQALDTFQASISGEELSTQLTALCELSTQMTIMDPYQRPSWEMVTKTAKLALETI